MVYTPPRKEESENHIAQNNYMRQDELEEPMVDPLVKPQYPFIDGPDVAKSLE